MGIIGPSSFVKTFTILALFVVIISYTYWSNLGSPSVVFIHRKPNFSDFQFDTPTGQNWTHRIWQTSRHPVVSIGDEDREHVKTWSDLNPDYRHEVLTDEMMESYVKDHFHVSHPEIEQMYSEAKDYILRSDLIRYLILLADGGVYNDLDVGCVKPISTWVPKQYKDSAGIVLGVEVDNKYGPDGRTFTNGADLFQLVNWTIMSKPNQPFIWFLVKRVIDNIKNLARSQQKSISDLTYTIQDVLYSTGPAALTRAFFDYASDITGSNVTYHNFTKIREPRLIGEVVILPIQAFGAGHQVEWAGGKQDGTELIHHYFAGSWKTDHVDAPVHVEVDEGKKAKVEEKKKQEEEKKKQEEEEEEKQQEDANAAQETEETKTAEAEKEKEEKKKVEDWQQAHKDQLENSVKRRHIKGV
jgi:mannosyltransferase OCH1-like enzyme